MQPLVFKMKLKYRLAVGLVCGIVVCLLVTQTSLFAMLSGGHLTQSSTEPWPTLRRTQKISPDGPAAGGGSRWQIARGHLNILRKDLDLSNYTADHIDVKSQEKGLRAQLTLQEDETLMAIRNRILNDNTFRTRDNLEKLFVAADFLKHERVNRVLGVEDLRNVMVPSKVDDFLHGGLTAQSDLARVKALDAKVQTTPEEIALLSKLVANPVHKSKDNRYAGKMLRLYRER